MSRPLRIQQPGLTYHVTGRGTGKMVIYTDDRDRHRFLNLLQGCLEEHEVDCHSYCLMGNHYHLVITTARPNVSLAMKLLNGTYAQWWNHRHDRVGHVFQGRFGAQVVQDGRYLLAACRYVVLNPVRAGLVADPADWRWSSYRATAGLARLPRYLRPEPIWSELGASDQRDAMLRYRTFVGETTATSHERRRLVVGDDAFVDGFKTDRQRASCEVPRPVRRVAPTLDALFVGAAARGLRDERAREAVHLGYTRVEVARFLDIHPSTVSKIIARRGSDREKSNDSRPDPP